MPSIVALVCVTNLINHKRLNAVFFFDADLNGFLFHNCVI